VLSVSKLPQHNSNIITAADSWTTTSDEPSSYLSMPRVVTQGERLEALYKRFGVLPRKPRQVTSKSTAASRSLTDTSPSTSLPTNSNKPPSSESESTSSRGIGKIFRGTNIKSAANLPTFYSRDRDSWMSYIKHKHSPHPLALGSTVKRLYQRMKSKKDASETPLSSSPSSPTSPSPVEQPLVPLTETSTASITIQKDAVEPTQSNTVKPTQADAVDATHDYPISPPHTSLMEYEMSSNTTVNASDTTASNGNISTDKVAHEMDQTSSGQAWEMNSRSSPLSSLTATSSEQIKVPYNRHTQAKPMYSDSAPPVNKTPSSDYIPTIAHIKQTSIQHHQNTQAMASELAQPIGLAAGSDATLPNEYISHSASNTTISIKHNTTLHNQHTQSRPKASELAQPVDMAPASEHTPYNAHNNHLTGNATKATATTVIEPPQNISNDGEKENSNASSSKYHSNDRHMSFLTPTYDISRFNDEKFKKRSLHSASTTQRSSSDKHITARPPALNVHVNYPTSTTATSINEGTIPHHQEAQAKSMVNDPTQPVNMVPLSVPPNAHNNLPKANAVKTTTAATTTVNTPQHAPKSDEKENPNASSNKYHYCNPLMSHSNMSNTTHVLPDFNSAQSRKRFFDQTEHSPSTIQGNSRKKCFPALPPLPKRRYRRH